MYSQVAQALFRVCVVALPMWALVRFRRGKAHAPKRELQLLLLVLYGCVVVAVTLMPLPITAARAGRSAHLNVVPLVRMKACVRPAGTVLPRVAWSCQQNVVGNLLLFMPLGVLLPWTLKRLQRARPLLLTALTISVAIELLQFAERAIGTFRSTDIDDVLLNVAGAGVGFACYRLLLLVFPPRVSA